MSSMTSWEVKLMGQMIKYNKFEKKLIESLNRNGNPEKGKRVLIGLSGGADSVSLTVALTRIKNAYPLEIFAFHLNHMLRGEESLRDMEFSKQLCEKLGVEFFSESVDVVEFAEQNKIGFEEAARTIRYQLFSEFSEKKQIDYILTAHNKNDVAETVLFHLIRGCGIEGLKGISYKRDNIIRPLLEFDREEIEAYCEDLSLEYVVDSTNNDTDYSRNYIRHVILADMKKLNPSIVDSLFRLSLCVKSACDAIDSFEKTIEFNNFFDLPDELLFRRLKNEFSKFSEKQLSFERYSEIKKALRENRNCIISLDGGLICQVKDKNVTFSKKEESLPPIEEKELLFGENVIDNDLKITFSFEPIVNKDEEYNDLYVYKLDADILNKTLRVRSRLVGDVIVQGKITRSIKKQLIEKKVPKELRNQLPIIFDDEGIVAAAVVGIADRAVPKNELIYLGIFSRKGFS